MNPGAALAGFATRHPKWVTIVMIQAAVILAVLALLPTVWPERFPSLKPLLVDTDPENMLPDDEPVRVYHDNMKKEMALYDMVVVGVVNEEHPDGVFNPDSLRRIAELTKFAENLQWPDPRDPARKIGVIPIDLIAPSTVDNIEQGDSPGVVTFSWLMRTPPQTAEEARAVRDKAERIPFLKGTVLSEDGRALCLYLPLTSKDLSNRVYGELQKRIATLGGEDHFYITGLPVAEDVFGVEMFKQMAISAPMAMLVVFVLMLAFFRKIALVLSPMIVAVVSVMITMGLLVVTGHTVHIMSSMIPIFIMPIAVLDAVHILSEFFDRYQATRDRRRTIVEVMETLFWPMLYTSLTTAVGFGSLGLTPIPPVQTFGLFVAFGVLVAWALTVVFIPAYIMFLKPESLENFGTAQHEGEALHEGGMARTLGWMGRLTCRRAKPIVVGVLVLAAVAVYGISRIKINDNPIKWFTRQHPIRVADRVLNRHFGGTYMAYLALEAEADTRGAQEYAAMLSGSLAAAQRGVPAAVLHTDTVFAAVRSEAERLARSVESRAELIERLEIYADERLFAAPSDELDAWDNVLDAIARERSVGEAFKRPEVHAFIEAVQHRLLATGIVGKSNSLTDIVKTVHRELVSGQDEAFRVPDTAAGVAQTLLQYQNSHRPQDLWHFVTPAFDKTVIWVQLKSGDNRDMEKVVDAMDAFMATQPQPEGVTLKHRWFGLTYINVIWQQRMVNGMLQAFLGSFLIVFLMMTILYRSALWGLLSMVPLTLTIAVIYGAIGLTGKDYDMPVAVLSSLSLGLAIDYAIHFLSRSRSLYLVHKSWARAAGPVFGEPAHAIARNVFVIGLGFLPLLAAPLVPYKTVGVFIAAILFMAGVATLLILPALMTLLEDKLFPRTRKCCLICNCTTYILSVVAVVAVVAINIYRFLDIGWTRMTWLSVLAVLVLAQVCFFVGRSKRCRMEIPIEEDDEK